MSDESNEASATNGLLSLKYKNTWQNWMKNILLQLQMGLYKKNASDASQ